jgi:CRP/FNR family transcriptional regulator/CRP/FNR family cyclic AMP-dependent transcriptional regulator
VTVSLIAKVPVFSQLSPEDLEALALQARERRYQRGEVIFHKDDPGVTFHIIAEGKVRIVLPSPEGEEVTLAILGPGEFFGEFSLLDGEPRSAMAIAGEDTRTVVVNREDFLSWLSARPAAAVALLAVLSRRLRRSDELLGDVAFLNVPGRLAKKLVQLSQLYRRETPEGEPVQVRLTQEELASTIGVTRESANKYLRYFSSKGWVALQKGRITILDPDALQEQIY